MADKQQHSPPGKPPSRRSSGLGQRLAEFSDEGLDFLDNIQIGDIIGYGSFGRVVVASSIRNGRQYAIRKVHLEKLDDFQYDLIKEEVKNISNWRHPNLLPLHLCVSWGTSVMFITPLMHHRSCDQIVRLSYPLGLPEEALGLITKDVLAAVAYLHAKNIIHRTIKGSHILISESGAAVLTGFRYFVEVPHGQSRAKSAIDTLTQMGPYLNWLSPEMLSQDSRGFGLNSDLYSIGITLCELGNGVVPFSEMSPSAMLAKKLQEPPPKLWDASFLPSEEDKTDAGKTLDESYKRKPFSPYLKNFLSVCLVCERTMRITTEEALKMKFIVQHARAPPAATLKSLSLLGRPLRCSPSAASADALLRTPEEPARTPPESSASTSEPSTSVRARWSAQREPRLSK